MGRETREYKWKDMCVEVRVSNYSEERKKKGTGGRETVSGVGYHVVGNGQRTGLPLKERKSFKRYLLAKGDDDDFFDTCAHEPSQEADIYGKRRVTFRGRGK